MIKNNSKTGIVKLIVLIVVVVLILSYLGVNIRTIAESETGQANFAYVWQICQRIGGWFVDLYQKYIAGYFEPIINFFSKYVGK